MPFHPCNLISQQCTHVHVYTCAPACRVLACRLLIITLTFGDGPLFIEFVADPHSHQLQGYRTDICIPLRYTLFWHHVNVYAGNWSQASDSAQPSYRHLQKLSFSL
jgi:hypothetical protein